MFFVSLLSVKVNPICSPANSLRIDFIRDPDDPTFHPVRDVLERNISTQLRKIAFSALVYGALVIVCLGGIVWGLYFAFDGLLPVRWSTTIPIFEYPLDLLFYNFVVPLAIKSIKPSDGMHVLFDWWLHECAHVLRLTDFFFGERRVDEEGYHVRRTWTDTLLLRRGDVKNSQKTSDQHEKDLGVYFHPDGKFVRAPASDQVRIPKSSPVFLEVTEQNERVDGTPDPDSGLHSPSNGMFVMVYIPPSFKTRIAAFLFLMWMFTAVTGLGITVFPLVIGRKIISFYFPGRDSVNDTYAISAGLCVMGLAAYALLYFRDGFSELKGHLRQYVSTPFDVCRELLLVLAQASRLFYISAAFSVLLPFLFAMIVELYVLIPVHTYFGSGEKHVIHTLQDWALGVIYLQMAIKFILWKSNSRPAAALNGIFRDGWMKPNVRLATRAFILPVTLLVGLAMFLPLALGFAIKTAMFRSMTGDGVFKIYRYSYPVTFVLGLAVWLGFHVHRQVDVWRVNFQDDVYLIGERLHNLPDGRTRPNVH